MIRLLLLLMMTLPTATWAGADPLPPLSLEAAIGLALKNNPQIHLQRERVNQADYDYSYAFSQGLPNLQATASAFKQKAAVNNGSALFNGESYNQYTVGLKLVQPLYQGGALTSALAGTRTEQDIRKTELEQSERDLSLQVFRSYFEVLLNQNLLETLHKVEQVQLQSLQTTQRYQRIGRGKPLDVLQIQTRIALLKPRIEQAQNDRLRAAAELATLLHETDQKEITIKESLKIPDPNKVVAYLKTPSVELPELRRSRKVVEKLGYQREYQMSFHWPNLNFQGTLGRTAFDKAELLEDFSTAWSLGLVLNIPLFSGFSSKHQRASLASQEIQASFDQSRLQDQLALGYVQSQRNLDTAYAVLKSSEEASRISQTAHREAERMYRVQTIDIFQYLSTQQDWLDAQSALENARYKYLTSLSQHFSSTGHPVSELVSLLK